MCHPLPLEPANVTQVQPCIQRIKLQHAEKQPNHQDGEKPLIFFVEVTHDWQQKGKISLKQAVFAAFVADKGEADSVLPVNSQPKLSVYLLYS